MLRIEPCLKLAGWAATDPEWMGLLLRMKVDPHFFPKRCIVVLDVQGKHCILLQRLGRAKEISFWEGFLACVILIYCGYQSGRTHFQILMLRFTSIRNSGAIWSHHWLSTSTVGIVENLYSNLPPFQKESCCILEVLVGFSSAIHSFGKSQVSSRSTSIAIDFRWLCEHVVVYKCIYVYTAYTYAY